MFVLVQIAELVLEPTGEWIATTIPGFAPPADFPPLLNPGNELELPLTSFLGVELRGAYWLILFWSVCLICNIIGEELWWRGYIQPRMELHFGRWAWLVHGLLWNFLFHMMLRWNYIVILPITLLLPYFCQRWKSTWVGIVIHGIGNTLLFLVIIPPMF